MRIGRAKANRTIFRLHVDGWSIAHDEPCGGRVESDSELLKAWAEKKQKHGVWLSSIIGTVNGIIVPIGWLVPFPRRRNATA